MNAPPNGRPWLRRHLVEATLAALAFGLCLTAVRVYSTDVAGGADSWGYVSEAARLRHGRFYEPEHVLTPLGLREDAGLTEPLGYTSRGKGGTVPVYPFGYPLLMAVAMLLGGAHAAFWVAPILAAGAVLLTYLLGRALFGRAGGAAAAALLALLPNFVWGAIQPLSDVPAAFFSALALVALLALPPGWPADVLLGAALGYGVWVRPNMALLVAVFGGWLALRKEWRRLARSVAALAPFLAVEAFVNWHLYGAPWRTGYGEIAFGAPLADVVARGWRHLVRLNVQQAGVGLLVVALALVANRLARPLRALLAATFAAFLAFFAFYRFDDAWWYFRFLVPAMPAVVVLEAGFFVRIADPGRWRRWRRVAAVVAVCAIVLGEWRYGRARHITTAKEGEQRYPNAARLAASVVKPPAIVLSMQDSGSLRYYAALPTARYDIPEPATLFDFVEKVAGAGARVYLVVEDWELERIANGPKRFLMAGATPLGQVGPGYTAAFLLDPSQIEERFRRGGEERPHPAEVAVVDGGWAKAGAVWQVSGNGAVGLPGDAEPALARVCAASALEVRRAGLPPVALPAGACADVPLLPGGSERVWLAGARGPARGTVEIVPLRALADRTLLATAYMVPQVARKVGEGGSLWQTDLVLVNPQRTPLHLTGLFLPDGRDNRRAPAGATTLRPGEAVTLRNVAGIPAFDHLGGLGALLVTAGTPGSPCNGPACRFLVCARTYDAVATRAAADSDEWLPGMPYAAGAPYGRLIFPDVPGGRGARASVGLASWSDRPMRVRLHASPSGGPASVREAIVRPFGHVRLDVGVWPAGGRVEVEVVGPAGAGRLFAYVSVVGTEDGAVRHLLPTTVSSGARGGTPPMPTRLLGGGGHGL